MPSLSLQAQGLGFSYSDIALFDDVTFQLPAGWTGLVGANGSGKSTLLALLAGELQPTHGVVRRTPGGARVVACAQRVDEPPPDLGDFEAACDGEAWRLRGLLGLSAAQPARWPSLSPGERKRWQLAHALWREPEVLLLDEPQNHLDGASSAFLLEALRGFRGVGLLVSHDRALLDALTARTLRLARGHLTAWPLRYSDARAAWEAEERQALTHLTDAQRALTADARRLDLARRQHEASTRQRSAGRRMKSAADSDARGLGADPGALLRSDTPSPGEARKLRLALGLGRPTWLLLLDEPTNHLDLPTVEHLERALAAWPGGLVLVTHDAGLAARCTTRAVALER